MFVPLLTERRSDGLCLLDHQPSTSGRCCRKLLSMNSAVPKLRSKDSSTEHPEPTVLVEGGFFRGPWSLCFSRDIFMFVPLLTERRSDGLCLLDHQPSTSGRCCRKLLSMNSAVPKLRSKDSSTEHPCSRLHQLTNRVQALLPA